jgi:hypothetical protein
MSLPLAYIRSWTGRKHKEHWQSICTKKQVKGFLTRPSAKRVQELLTLTELQLGIMMGPLTGHCHLREHLFEVGLADSPGCDRREQATETTIPCIVAVRL